MNTLRRRFLHLAIGSTALPIVSLIAGAQTYPSRPVSLIVFVPAGGTPDIIARLIGQSMSRRLGQPVVIDNRPGAGGNMALAAVARAPADGYTLLLVATPHAINVTLYEKHCHDHARHRSGREHQSGFLRPLGQSVVPGQRCRRVY